MGRARRMSNKMTAIQTELDKVFDEIPQLVRKREKLLEVIIDVDNYAEGSD